MRWAIERAANPTVLRIHVDRELTARTIETCPPADAPAWLGSTLGIEGVRSLDLHRYRVRVNLAPGADPVEPLVRTLTTEVGTPAELPPPELPRAFEIPPRSGRLVAESLEMAGDDPLAGRLFRTEGVAEAILGEDVALVRLGRLFRWSEVEPAVRNALRT